MTGNGDGYGNGNGNGYGDGNGYGYGDGNDYNDDAPQWFLLGSTIVAVDLNYPQRSKHV
jgi:hypothetical protein